MAEVKSHLSKQDLAYGKCSIMYYYWERLGAGGEGEAEDEMVDGIADSMDVSVSELRELVMDREACVLGFMGWQRVRND